MNAACAASRNCWALLRAEILAVGFTSTSCLIRTRSSSRLERGKHVSTLEVDIEVPNGFERSRARRGGLTRGRMLDPVAP